MSIDFVVLVTIAMATLVVSLRFRQRGARGRAWLQGAWVAFHGFTLTAMMAAHSIEVAYHLMRGDTRISGEPWAYDFHFYGLQLLGGILIWVGIRCLLASRSIAVGRPDGRRTGRQTVLVTLILAAPLIPIHGFFGVLLTVLSLLTLAVLAVPAREPHAGVTVRA